MTTPLYTLEDAKVLGRRYLCESSGHQIYMHNARGMDGRLVYTRASCENCDVKVKLDYPPLPSGAPITSSPHQSVRGTSDGLV